MGGNNKHLCSSGWLIKVHRNPQLTKSLLTLTKSLKENGKRLHYPRLSVYLSALVAVVCAKMTKYNCNIIAISVQVQAPVAAVSTTLQSNGKARKESSAVFMVTDNFCLNQFSLMV